MNSQFKKGIIELCVLSKIHEKDMYGYEVVKEISEFIDVNENTIYPILRRLTKEENFTTYTDISGNGQIRKYYKITNQGQENFYHMINEWDDFLKSVNLILRRGESIE